MNRNPVIVALDFESAAEARALVTRLGTRVDFYKVGIELYVSAGMQICEELLERGKRVFLDLKFYDIGETVRRAVAQVARSGVTFLTVHAVDQVMRAAVEGRGESELKLLAVTVLTSLDQQDVSSLGHSCSLSELVSSRVLQAMAAGVDGVIASPAEARAVRAIAGPRAILVTPGVRSRGASPDDQKRVATPAEAMRDGADYLVIGRQITRAADPSAELDRILHELEAVTVHS